MQFTFYRCTVSFLWILRASVGWLVGDVIKNPHARSRWVTLNKNRLIFFSYNFRKFSHNFYQIIFKNTNLRQFNDFFKQCMQLSERGFHVTSSFLCCCEVPPPWKLQRCDDCDTAATIRGFPRREISCMEESDKKTDRQQTIRTAIALWLGANCCSQSAATVAANLTLLKLKILSPLKKNFLKISCVAFN